MLTLSEWEAMIPRWRAVQKPKEFHALIQRAMELPAKHVLEIGVWFGGTLRAWQQALPNDGLLVAVDRSFEPFDKSTAALVSDPPETVMIEADSGLVSTAAKVLDTFRGRPIDIAWIDGSHDYADVRRDLELYGPLVRDGGLIAFHDIAECPSQPWVGVRRLWLEIKNTMPSEEFIFPPDGWGGIGVLQKLPQVIY